MNNNFEYDITILYKPLKKEVDYNTDLFPIKISDKKIFLPQNKNTDPFEIAQKCTDECKNKKVCILIPGKKFDQQGTRHGKGGGWFDKFLSRVPKNWTRIGVATKEQMSKTKLKKEIWDESMNWLIVLDDQKYKIINCSKKILPDATTNRIGQ